MSNGRFAPSPSGDLHVGNLRTALLAWLFARSTGRGFLMRVEDLDRVRPGAEEQQLDDLRSLGIDWDGDIVRQSDRRALLRRRHRPPHRRRPRVPVLLHAARDPRRPVGPAHAARLVPRHLPRPHRSRARPAGGRASGGAQAPGRHRRVDDRGRAARRRSPESSTTSCCAATTACRPTTSRSSSTTPRRVSTRSCGATTCSRRRRGRRISRRCSGHEPPTYAHVPLALNTSGQRLAKRDGAVTRTELERAASTCSR